MSAHNWPTNHPVGWKIWEVALDSLSSECQAFGFCLVSVSFPLVPGSPTSLLGRAFGVFVLLHNHPSACLFPTDAACFHLFPRLPWQICLQTHSSGQCGRLLVGMGLQNHHRATSLNLPRHLPFSLRYCTTTFSLLSPSPGNSCHPTLTLLENSLSSSRVRREHDFCHYCSSLETLVLSVLHN